MNRLLTSFALLVFLTLPLGTIAQGYEFGPEAEATSSSVRGLTLKCQNWGLIAFANFEVPNAGSFGTSSDLPVMFVNWGNERKNYLSWVNFEENSYRIRYGQNLDALNRTKEFVILTQSTEHPNRFIYEFEYRGKVIQKSFCERTNSL